MGKEASIPEEFARFISGACAHSPLEPDRPLFWIIIANPRAGGFTIRSRWKEHRTLLREYSLSLEKVPLRPRAAPALGSGLVLTGHKGHAASITQELIGEALGCLKRGSGEKPLFLIITAGGDGTSLEVLGSLYRAPEEARSLFAVLRLPMGTGNDGADARELGRALDFLTKDPVIRFQRALSLSTSAPGKGPFLAFNILSVGLDAFVTHMTNKMKGRLPGDSYKLWVDLAALFYDRIYRVGFSEVRALDEGGKEICAFREKLILLAVGESGRRTYGSNKRILPDERNVCAVRQMPLLRKLALKGLFSTGEHVSKKESILFNARRIEFSCEYPLLAQMDGETVLLEKNDFPAAIELSEPLIPVLGRKEPTTPPTG
ncbi:MAG: diacylglycerol kinase [Treponema sp.]|jgi:diacylglycerol kinase family enzyme|nr:diacylglycerol kinase [Treponema sp.]